MCEYCYKRDDGEIMGRTIRTNDLKKTAGYEELKNRNDFLEMFILKLKNDKNPGLMIDNGYGYRYIDINYCMFCRKEAGGVNIADKNSTLWEDIKIIFGDKYINLFNNIEPDYENNCMKGLTLNDCLRIAKENGYQGGTIMVLSESFLDGDVYRYGNYLDDEWYEIGKLAGFA